jgi:putative MFS transporter
MSTTTAERLAPVSKRSPALGWFGAFVGYLFDYYEIALMAVIIVPIRTEFKLSLGSAALIPGIVLLFLAVGGVSFGALGDRIGRRNVLYVTIFTYAIGTLARAFTFDYTWLAVWTAIAGLGLGGEFGVGQALISEIAPIKKRGLWSGAFYAAGGIGIILTGLVGMFLLSAIGWRLVFAVSGLVSFLPLTVRFWTPESGLWEKKKTERMVSFVTKRSFVVPFFFCLLIGTLQFFSFYLVNSTLPLYLTGLGLTIAGASYYVFVTGLGVLTGSLLAAFLSDKIGRRWVATIGALLFAFWGVILFTVGVYIAANPVILVLFFLLSIGTSMDAAMLGVLFSEQFSTKVRSFGTTSSVQIARGLSFFPPLISAAIYPLYGYNTVFLIGAIISVAEAFSFWTVKEKRGEELSF